MNAVTYQPLGWLGIVRLGLVQAALGAVVAMTTSTLNRVMVVEMALPALLPAALVALHFAVQITRPRWGYGSDMGARRTPWIIGGMACLCLGALGATDGALMTANTSILGLLVSVVAYVMIGIGVGASGTSLLALLATRVTPTRRPAAASITWIMMIVGIVISSIVVGALIEPFSPQKLAFAATGVAGAAFLITLFAVHKVELAPGEILEANEQETLDEAGAGDEPSFWPAIKEIWADPLARHFTIFVFVSMLAYSAQDLILEPFAGLIFHLTPGQSTQMSGLQNMGTLLGMVLTGALGGRFTKAAATDTGNNKTSSSWMGPWVTIGCIGSALALLGLACAAKIGTAWPLKPNVLALGFFNGVFAVSAIGSMMGLAGMGQKSRVGMRMGIWGAAQAIAFGLGGLLGAAGVDGLRAVLPFNGQAFFIVFTLEALMFLFAAYLAIRLAPSPKATQRSDPDLGSLSLGLKP
ncbi:BCD family MFS transporter [Candidatus Phycosocius spiralis]|uniref:Bacteriochlorophyll synthase n=1 Tax=Candidatus Phycosocius spiralis TaxID=2815099 RepID=A0ABQ4PUU7_9PROT|nr:BCD family MFS transporter [Candidatus Phycosocius spiralis]GIU66710.1 bacteriochlorophyll synthase [Candidatus Phycosocius spiralis]